MSHKLDNKKRSILESLNCHLQIQATRLKNVNDETNFLPDYQVPVKDNKKSIPTVHSKPLLNKTFLSNKIVTTPVKSVTSHVNNRNVRKLRPYDPLYTWNRGGRLKELRIRCQARKFFYLWRNKTIGPITCLGARNYYRQRLVRMAWETWYDQYWLLRVEPRRFGRAILFRKAVLLRQIFDKWHLWASWHRHQRVQVDLAIKFHNNKLKQSALNNWISWIFVNKCKNKLNLVAETWSRRNALHGTFSIWKNELCRKLEDNAKLATADSHYGMILKTKIFQNWTEIRPILRHSKLNQLKAANNYTYVCSKRIFRHWKEYHHKRRLKQKEKDKWDNHYHWNLAHRCLIVWRHRYSQSLIQSAMDARANKLAERFQIARFFSRWRRYHENEKIRMGKVKKANELQNKIIQRRVLLRIKSYVAVTRHKKVMNQAAQGYRDRFTLKHHLNQWISRHDEKDDQDRLLELGAARSHYRRAISIKCLRKWAQYCEMARATNKVRNITDSFYQRNLMTRVIECWVIYVGMSKCKTQLLKAKECFVRSHIVEKYWRKWKDEAQNRIFLEKRLSEFLLHQENCQKLNIFRKWQVATNLRTKEKFSNSKAIGHYKDNLKQKYFQKFLHFINRKRQTRINNDLANQHLISKIFYEWRNYCLKKRQHKILLLFRFHKIQNHIKYIIFNSWRTLVTQKMANTAIANKLFETKRKNWILKAFHAWQYYVAITREKKNNTLYRINEVKIELDIHRKKKTFQKWRYQTSLKLSEYAKLKEADDLFSKRCMRKYLVTWMKYHNNYKMKLSMKQTSLWYFQRSEQVRIWLIWRRALCDRQREQYYTRFALVHWSHKLQEKVFFSWSKYIIIRRNTTYQETEAFNMYKQRLKMYTLRQWLTSADFLGEWRKEQDRTNNCRGDIMRHAVDQWKRFTQARTMRHISVRPGGKGIHSEIGNPPSLRQYHKEQIERKIRPQPKVPKFLLDVSRSELLPGAEKCYQSSQIDYHEPYPTTSHMLDDILLPPSSFVPNCGGHIMPLIASQERSDEALFQEVLRIKARLQQFNESKTLLRDLEAELAQYDLVLPQLATDNDSSFYQEFSPLDYRHKLHTSIEGLQRDLASEKIVCIELSRRFQEIMEVLRR